MTSEITERQPILCAGRHEHQARARRAYLCDGCRENLYNRLVAVPDLARMARLETQGLHAASGEGKVSGSKDSPLPGGTLIALFGPSAGDHLSTAVLGDSKAMALQDPTVPIPAILGTWVRAICEDRNLRGPKPDLKSVCTFLREHSEWCADQEWADEFDTEIREIHNRLLTAAGAGSSRTRWPDAECPECNAKGSLIRWDGQDEIRCHSALGGCGARMSAYYATAIRATQEAS